jgi:hypothetical protein
MDSLNINNSEKPVEASFIDDKILSAVAESVPKILENSNQEFIVKNLKMGSNSQDNHYNKIKGSDEEKQKEGNQPSQKIEGNKAEQEPKLEVGFEKLGDKDGKNVTNPKVENTNNQENEEQTQSFNDNVKSPELLAVKQPREEAQENNLQNDEYEIDAANKVKES